MNKLILVESIEVGKFTFQGYIVEREENILSYCIFINNMDIPLLELIADMDLNVRMVVNKEVVLFINKNKTEDKKLRKAYFKQFYTFIIASEKKASYMVFKKQKLNYIKKSMEIVEIKRSYLNE